MVRTQLKLAGHVERTGSELLPKNADAHGTDGQHCSGKTVGRASWEDWEGNGE